jgi:hypothetical protein
LFNSIVIELTLGYLGVDLSETLPCNIMAYFQFQRGRGYFKTRYLPLPSYSRSGLDNYNHVADTDERRGIILIFML